jgi:hypothetical protein
MERWNSKTNRAYEIAQAVVEAGIWDNETAYAFVVSAADMSNESLDAWENFAFGDADESDN